MFINQIATVQTAVSALLQTFFTISIGVLLSLSQSAAVDATIRHPPPLGSLHVQISAWSGLWSSFMATVLYMRAGHRGSTGYLWRIFLYFAISAILQISSSSILASTVDPNPNTPLDTLYTLQQWPLFLGAPRMKYLDSWATNPGISSDSDVFKGLWQAVRSNMFAGAINDTRYPGLQGRLIHDTVAIDHGTMTIPPYTEARVDATLMNIHCSQVSDASANLFALPMGSTDFSVARPANSSGVLFTNDTTSTEYIWINFTMHKPPYWDPDVPGLNFTALWDIGDSLSPFPTKVMFQPWYFAYNTNQISGHHQVVIILASGRPDIILKDSVGGFGNLHNFSVISCYGSYCNPPLAAYVQLLGCTLRSSDLTATIDNQGYLLSPNNETAESGSVVPNDDHVWDEFSWEDQTNVTVDRHLTFAFKPSSAYNTSISALGVIGDLEHTLARTLDGRTLAPSSTYPLRLVDFQYALENLFASYVWNLARLCTPFFNTLDPYECISGIITPLFADLVYQSPVMALQIVKWRAILSLICSILVTLLAIAILGNSTDRSAHEPLHNGGFLDVASLMRDSSIPEVVSTQMQKKARDSEVELVSSLMQRKLRYNRNHDLVTSNLDVVDSDDHAGGDI